MLNQPQTIHFPYFMKGISGRREDKDHPKPIAIFNRQGSKFMSNHPQPSKGLFFLGQPRWGCAVTGSVTPPDKSGGYAQATPTVFSLIIHSDSLSLVPAFSTYRTSLSLLYLYLS